MSIAAFLAGANVCGAAAQSAPQPLPSVTVDSPRPVARPAMSRAGRATTAGTRRNRNRVAAPVLRTTVATAPALSGAGGSRAGESPDGPINGYVATQSRTATKSAAPLIETPASIAVVGAEQIRDQAAQSLSEAVRYSPGIRAEQFGANSRLDFYTIRGFKADDTGLYRDGLQLFSTAFANFRTEPFGLERIEILRGPASVLYGCQSAPERDPRSAFNRDPLCATSVITPAELVGVARPG